MGVEEPQVGGGGVKGGPRNDSSLQEEGLLLSPFSYAQTGSQWGSNQLEVMR